MTTTIFSHDVRVLLCARCGAPLEAPVAGGTVGCRYCRAQNMFAARPHAHANGANGGADARRPGAIAWSHANDPGRLAMLAVQLHAVTDVPVGLRPFLFGGWRFVQPTAVEKAWSMFQAALVRSRHGDALAAEELVFLAAAFFEHLRGEPLRRRAVAESALDALTLDRHRVVMLGLLARGAASEGDLASAEAWCAEMMEGSEDLAVESELRVSRAFLSAATGQVGAIPPLLGHSSREVPITPRLQVLADLLRAHGLETAGHMDAAQALLEGHTRQRATTLDLDEVRAAFPSLHLAPRSHAAVAARIAELHVALIKPRWDHVVLWTVVVGFAPVSFAFMISPLIPRWSMFIIAAILSLSFPAILATHFVRQDRRRMEQERRIIHEGISGRMFLSGQQEATLFGAMGKDTLVRYPDGTIERHLPRTAVSMNLSMVLTEQLVARRHPEMAGDYWYECGGVSPYRPSSNQRR
ncbi:hypothetical protein [Chondromyces apiculatus]|uniref:Uncharacterized protein n=1 Tax=Chondromyces apiculatus DSM 436 TaxID=1192034 RepID=A0A017T7S9_9BACT|nr:hypothetical protein [Chondromyces apiculatus]EYF04631.1 Hypothetical protein CAP_4307 [Chondromyces apiculatus DSM 436]